MKCLSLLCLFALSISNCKNGLPGKRPTYDDFIFSFSAESENYSIKFAHNDTLFLEERFPKPKQLYYAVLQEKDLEKVDSFFIQIEFTLYDTIYFQNNLHDGASYKFYLTKDKTVNWFLIYGNTGPKALYDFAYSLIALKDRLTFHPISEPIDFGNLTYIVLPPIPPPPDNSH